MAEIENKTTEIENEDLEASEKDEKAAAEAVAEENNESPSAEEKTKRSKKKIIISVAAIIVAVVFLVQCIITVVLYGFALKPGGFSRLMKSGKSTEQIEESGKGFVNKQGEKWVDEHSEDKYLTSDDGLKLHAYYLKNENYSHSYALLCHPYTTYGKAMATYAEHYYELGFNILMPDARGHGESEGNYIGMGWDDRLDVIKWINTIIEEDPEARILLHGVSMGGATVAMVSGEKLPSNVRCIIDDCGYSSVWNEFEYQIGEMFSLPSFPLLNMASAYTELRAGWNFKEASALDQVKKSVTPTLFIHGDADDFVPKKQGDDLYDACVAEKGQLIIEGAGHAVCESKDPEKYWAEVDRFMLNNFGLCED